MANLISYVPIVQSSMQVAAIKAPNFFNSVTVSVLLYLKMVTNPMSKNWELFFGGTNCTQFYMHAKL